jgi:hypothetical protein
MPWNLSLLVSSQRSVGEIAFVAAEMRIGTVVYWLVVAAVCAAIVYRRLVLKPIRRGECA